MPTSPVVDYTSLDFESILEAMKRYAQEKYGLEGWTDFNANQFAVMLLECFAYGFDLTAFQINALSKEAIIALATREQNVRNSALTLGYTVPSATQSSGPLEVHFDPDELPFNLPSTFQFGNEDVDNLVVFQPVADVTITSTPTLVEVIEGVGYLNEAVATSDGTVNQKHGLLNSPLIDNTLSVLVAGIQWTQVANVAKSGPTDQHFRVETREDGRSFIVFGDGVFGAVPASGAAITASYKTGGGKRGNLARGTVTRLISSDPAVLSCNNNANAMTGGLDRPLIPQLRRAIPASLSTLERAVSLKDYSELALSVPGVAKAQAKDGKGVNEILLKIAPGGGGSPSDALKNAVVAFFKDKKSANKRVTPDEFFFQDVELELVLNILDNYRRSDVIRAVRKVITNLLSFENQEPGQKTTLQELYDELAPDKVPGVKSVFIKKFRGISTLRTRDQVVNNGNGQIFVYPNEDLLEEGNSYRFVQKIRIDQTAGAYYVTVEPLMRGEVTDANANSITDVNQQTVFANYLVGELVNPNEELEEQLEVSGVTGRKMVFNGNPLSLTSIGSYYTIPTESASTTRMWDSKVVAVTNGTQLQVVDGAGFEVGDEVLIFDESDSNAIIGAKRTITDVTGNIITIDSTSGMAANDVVSILNTQSPIFSLAFITGSSPFVAGDSYFVDLFPTVDDIWLREGDILRLLDENLVINPIGGITV